MVVNYPSAHPLCSSTIPCFEPDEIDAMFEEDTRIAKDPETRERYYVPASMTYKEWPGKYVEKAEKDGIISTRGGIINKHIEFGHPVDVVFGVKELSRRQQNILDKLPGYGSQAIVNKRDVSMIDLSALTAKTGDEFAMFTRGGKRLIVRGSAEDIPLRKAEIVALHDAGYRWSGHTHPGITEASLIASQGDKDTLILFRQRNSVIYNSTGKHNLIYPKEE